MGPVHDTKQPRFLCTAGNSTHRELMTCDVNIMLEILKCAYRAPDNPHEQLVKRVIALDGDMLFVPETQQVEKVPQVGGWEMR